MRRTAGNQQADRQVRDLVGKDIGGIGYHNAPGRGRIYVDGVIADTEFRDDLQPGQAGKLCLTDFLLSGKGNCPYLGKFGVALVECVGIDRREFRPQFPRRRKPFRN